ncbi:hypothetical protein GCM10007094_25980 [Pseudovibrio japonicus]|uniref:SPOR domain-containing protein n=1 Tax=Pseudovibrio japonicus TaxID=366534 RepID=A0ABQ3EEC2_9HYPH|nr:SPOR domain-containing protein [Pseudovibrio japonicus]GHB35272.1 hypothetical protein GCM10007094_25980 [Pseudovibrio japonicus]
MLLPHKINELREKPKVLQERVTVLAWGIAALSFAALAASAIQMPGKFAHQAPTYEPAALPLPLPGPVTTTASTGRTEPLTAVQMYDSTRKVESESDLQNSRELHAIREEIISLRRSLLRITEQNRRLSHQLKTLEEATKHARAEPKPNLLPPRKAANTGQDHVAPVETLPAPELLQKQQPSDTAGPIPEMILSKVVAVPNATPTKEAAPEPVVAEPLKTILPALPKFHKTPAAGKLHQSGAGKITRTSFAVDLGNFDNATSVESQWRELTESKPLLLGDLTKRVSATSTNGATQYTLTAGPFYNAADTALVCARLAREKVNCAPTTF